MIKVNYTETLEENDSDLEDMTSITTKKVTYNDMSEFELSKLIKQLHHDYDLAINIKLKLPPEDQTSEDDETAE